MNEIKYLDQKGLEYLWSKLSLEDYPNNELLIAVINAIDEGKANKEEVPTKISQLENDSNFTSEEQVEALYKQLNSNTVLAFYCIEEVTINQNGVTTVYPANSNVEVKFLEGETFEIIPTSDNSIMSLSAFPGAISTFYPWLEGVKQFSNILFDMNPEEMYTKWNQGNQGAYQVQYAQYVNCIFWSDNPYISELSKRTNYTLYYSSQLPLCYSSIPDNTFKAFYLAFGVNSDPNWGNKAYRDSFAKATYATQVFSYYGARTIGIFGHDYTDFNIVLPKDCRGLMSAATAIENAGTFDAEFVTNFGAKSGSWRDAFGRCSSLRNLYIKNLKVNLNVSWSPLNYDSISFIISEATNTNAITISVSPYTYNLLRQVDFDLAASKNITIELITTNYIEDKRLTAVGDKINNGATLVNSNELSAALHEAQFYTDNAISQVGAVSYSKTQELTNEQKIQARDNIAAQAKLEGVKGQIVGFDANGNMVAQDSASVETDDTLTIVGAAADAKAAGDKIAEAYSTAVSAQNTANSANTAATNAQNTANSAKEDAEAGALAATIAMPGSLKFDGNLEGKEFIIMESDDEISIGYIKLTDEIPPDYILEIASSESGVIIGMNYLGTYIGQRAQLIPLSETLYMIDELFVITTEPISEEGISLTPGIYTIGHYLNLPGTGQIPYMYGSGLNFLGYSFGENNGGKYFEKRTEIETIHYGDTLTWDGKVGDRWSFSEDGTTIVHLSDSTPPLDRVADITTVWSINGEEQIPTSVDIDTNVNGVAELYFRINGSNWGIFIVYQDNYSLFPGFVVPKKGIYALDINSNYPKSITLSGYDFVDENSITREVIKTEHLPEALRFGSMPTTYGSAKVVNGVLTWDGNTDGLDGFNATETVKYVKVLSTWPTVFDDASNNVTGTVVVSDGTSANFTIHSNATGIWGSNGNDGDAGDGTLLMFTNDESVATFEKDTGFSVTKGVYLCSVSNSDTYISSISLDGYKFIGEKITPIDKKYLPEALQFGAESALCGSATITNGILKWDGNTNGLDSYLKIQMGNAQSSITLNLYKVSNGIPEELLKSDHDFEVTGMTTDNTLFNDVVLRKMFFGDGENYIWGLCAPDVVDQNLQVMATMMIGFMIIPTDEIAKKFVEADNAGENASVNNVTKGIYMANTAISSISARDFDFPDKIVNYLDETYIPKTILTSKQQYFTEDEQVQICKNIGAATLSKVDTEIEALGLELDRRLSSLNSSLGALTDPINCIADANALLTQGAHFGIYATNSATVGSPYNTGASPFASSIIISYASNTSYGIQLAMPSGSEQIFVRRLHSGNIQSWKAESGSTSGSVILNSSTPGSTKKFELTVDDTGTITATEITN